MSRIRAILFVALAAIAGFDVSALEMPDSFRTWIKNPNGVTQEESGVTMRAREGYFDTGVPAKSGVEIEADIGFETAHKGSYCCGLAAWTSSGDNQGFVAPLLFNQDFSATDVKTTSYISIGYGSTTSDIFPSDVLTANNTRRKIRARLAAGEQWLYVDGVKKVDRTDATSYDTGRSLYLFAGNANGSWSTGGPFILHTFKIYTVEGTGDGAVRTLVRDYAPCVSDGEPALYDFVTGTIAPHKGRYWTSTKKSVLYVSDEATNRCDAVQITAEPEAFRAVTPSVGAESGLTAGWSKTYTAPSGKQVVDESTSGTCAGWKLYEYNASTSQWDLKSESTSLSYAYTHTGAANLRRLVCQWNVDTRYAVSATTDEPGATVTVSKSSVEPGESVTFTATAPANRVFWKWTATEGEVPAEHVYDSTFTMAITGKTSFVAYFAGRATLAPGGDIASALSSVGEGGVVELQAGDYPVTAAITVDGGRRLVGAGRDQTRIVLDGSLAKGTLLTLADSRSVVSELTLTATESSSAYHCMRGLYLTDGVFANGRISGLYAATADYALGLGVYMTGGTLRNTEVSRNYVQSSGGSHVGVAGVYMTGGLVENCSILSNEVNYSSSVRAHGAGLKITDGAVTGTLIAWNREQSRTPGVAATGGTLTDCVIVSNVTQSAAWAGVYNDGATFTRCTIDKNLCYAGTAVYNVRSGRTGTFVDCTIGDLVHPGTPTVLTVTSVEALAEAVAGACDGSVITLASGDYTLASTLYLTNAITLCGGAKPEDVRVTAAKDIRPFYLRNAAAVVTNLTVTGSTVAAAVITDGGTLTGCRFEKNSADSDGGAVRMYASGTLAGCTFRENFVRQGSRDAGGGAVYFAGRNGFIDRCLFVSNYLQASSLTERDARFRRGLAVSIEGTAILRSCLFARNHTRTSSGAGTVSFENTDGWTGDDEFSEMSNCTLADNWTAYEPYLENPTYYADETVAGVVAHARVNVVNCIIDRNVDYAGVNTNIYVSYNSTLNMTYSQINAGTAYDGNEGMVTGDPKFWDRGRNDYRLDYGSPCVNAGIYQDWMVGARDLAGNPRIVRKRVDMGAYEGDKPGLVIYLLGLDTRQEMGHVASLGMALQPVVLVTHEHDYPRK